MSAAVRRSAARFRFFRKNSMNYNLRFAINLALLSCAIPALAYETSTHVVITTHAAARSVLAYTPAGTPTLLSDLGLPDWNSSTYVKAGGPYVQQTASQVIEYGAVNEDNDYNWRAFNHFFDPQFNGLKGRGLSVGVEFGNPSPDWILEDRALQTDHWDGNGCNTSFTIAGCPQQYSFRKGQQYLFNVLTGATMGDRDRAAYLMFQNIGHVVHHVQDMGQPEHTRNDQHMHPVPVLNSNPQWSFYELHTERHNVQIANVLANYPYPKKVTLPTARQFWHDPTSTVPMYVGMAEYTANNFTSFGRQYVGRTGDATFIGPAPGFPLPNGSNRRIERYTTPPMVYPDGRTRSGLAEYVVGKIYDGYTNTYSEEIPLAAASLLSDLIPNGTPIYVENQLTYNAQYPLLIPRAAAFSTGMIDHFFRGRIDIAPGTGNNWTIKNTGTQAMIGTFSVYGETLGAVRTMIPGALGYRNLAAGASTTMTFIPPSGTVKLIAVFRGQIGAEGNSQDPAWSAVAGKVISYTEPEIVIVGTSWSSAYDKYATQRGFRWSSKNGMRSMPLAQGAYSSQANGVSPDGKWVVGSTLGPLLSQGAQFGDYGYYLNGQIPPYNTNYNFVRVATSWRISGDSPDATRFLNAGRNYSVAWRTTNSGREVKGEATLPSGVTVFTSWNDYLYVTVQPAGVVFTPNSLVSDDGSITLSNSGSKASYFRNGVTTPIPALPGHDMNEANHVVIIR
jgi:hypothetical protein